METINGIFKVKMCKEEIINRIEQHLKEGGDINVKIKGGSLLHKATLIELAPTRIPVIEYLLDKGIDVNMKNENGRTPLFRFIYHNNNKLTNKLLDAGADVNVVDNAGEDILNRVYNACTNLKTTARIFELTNEVTISQERFDRIVSQLYKYYSVEKVQEALGTTKLLRYWI
jgi:hypothetical protein